LTLAMAVLVTVYGLAAAGCGSYGSQPSTSSTPNGAY
jgi:hypothetical protein